MWNAMLDAAKSVVEGPLNAHRQMETHLDVQIQKLYLINRGSASLKDRDQAWFDFTIFPPFDECLKQGNKIQKRIIDEKAINFSDLNLVRFLMNEENIGLGPMLPELGRDNEVTLREQRIVDTIRVVESEMFKNGQEPTDEIGWENHFSKIMNFFDPKDLSQKPDQYPEARALRGFVFGYLISWKSPDDFSRPNTEGSVRYSGLVNWFKKLEDGDRTDVANQLKIFERKTQIPVIGDLTRGLTVPGSKLEDHDLARSLR